MIPFTQYILPYGRKKNTEISRPGHIEAMAQEIRAQGYHFESEILRTGVVSLTVVSPHDDEGDIAIILCRNEKEVPEKVDELVRSAWKFLHGGGTGDDPT